MSHRVISIDPIKRRIAEYEKMQPEQMEAIMESLELLQRQGFELGGKMKQVLKKRGDIKRRNQK